MVRRPERRARRGSRWWPPRRARRCARCRRTPRARGGGGLRAGEGVGGAAVEVELVVQPGGAQVFLEPVPHGRRRHRVVGADHQQHGARSRSAPVLVEQVEPGVHRGDAGDGCPGAEVLERRGTAEAVTEEGQWTAGELRLRVERRVGGGDATQPPVAVLDHGTDQRPDLGGRGRRGALAPYVGQKHRMSGRGEPRRVADHLLADAEGVVDEQDRGGGGVAGRSALRRHDQTQHAGPLVLVLDVTAGCLGHGSLPLRVRDMACATR